MDTEVRIRPQAIIVVGPFRSGTSLASRILSTLGVDFGPPDGMLKADRFNPDGYYQHVGVRIANNRLIRSVGSSVAWPEHPRVLADKSDLKHVQRVHLEWTNTTEHWGIKDPRFCATLLAWIAAGVFDPSRLVIVRMERNLDEAAKDLHGMPELSRQMAQPTLDSARETIGRYAELAAWHTDNLGIPSLAFNYNALLLNPKECIGHLADFIHSGNKQQIEVAAQCVRAPR